MFSTLSTKFRLKIIRNKAEINNNNCFDKDISGTLVKDNNDRSFGYTRIEHKPLLNRYTNQTIAYLNKHGCYRYTIL